MSEINNLMGQILTMRGALKRIDGMCSEAGRYNEIVADRVIDRVQEIARKGLGSDSLNDVEIDEAAAALAAKDAEIERLRKACRGGNAINSTAFLLEFLSDRLVAECGENDNTDYIRAAQERAAMLRAALAGENV